MAEIELLLKQGFERHQAGDLGAAQALYQRVLAAEPEHPQANHLLGVLCLQRGESRRAIELIERAVKREPRSAASPLLAPAEP